ncbi:MAG: B12-binding domain-containing protein, partial [Firmicutes bacterium]|nr:B12-binding domain-containing protein [Bacillota bacterium]
MSADILAKLKRAVEEQDVSAAEEAAHEALVSGMDPFVAINEGLAPAMKTISDLFDEGEIFVPQILYAAEAFQNAMAILVKNLTQDEIDKSKIGKVIVHTVQGDI